MAQLNENLALMVKVMCGRNHLDISILLISQEITGSPPDDEIRSAIHKVALSLYHLVSKRKNKNMSLESLKLSGYSLTTDVAVIF